MTNKKKWTITTIKAEPGYMIVFPIYPSEPYEPFTELVYEPIIAWEIQRFEEFIPPYEDDDWPDSIWTDIVAVGDSGGRANSNSSANAGSVGVKRPDGSCYIGEESYTDEQHMLRSLSAERAKRRAEPSE